MKNVDETGRDDALENEPFEDGFTWKTIIGSIFVGLIMAPGAIYLGLVAGQGLGAAAQWVTIVLFAEIARRSFLPLRRQEIFLLYYVAGGLASVALGDRGISGGPFGFLIWNQYFVQSPPAAPIVHDIPAFASPQPGSFALDHRTFFHKDWGLPILVLMASQILERVSWLPAGYLLFRITSDVERLPFPLAKVAAAGATALAEGSGEDTWRWRTFSTGTIVGLVFGGLYTAVPVLTGVGLGKAVTLLPIPFIDLMSSTERILPAAPVGISANLGLVLLGFVLPFSMVVGSFIGSVFGQMGLNPVFFKLGLLKQWHPGTESIQTKIVNNFDLWLSIGIGVQLAIAVIGIIIVVKGMLSSKTDRGAWNYIPAGRGDTVAWAKWAILIWLAATLAYTALTKWLLPTFPLWLLLVYGLVWTPLNSFIAARMYGLTSQGVQFPFLKELTILQAGYQKIDVWFAPMPLHDYGYFAQLFREVELTRTKFTSVFKAELLMFPILMLGGLVYWQFIWHSSPIPSPQYPFAQKIWPIHAQQQNIWVQINRPDGAKFVMDALKPVVIGVAGVSTLVTYGGMALLKLPMLAFYGAAGGLNAFPADTLPMFIGACVGRYHFARKYGTEKWAAFAPVLLAGFACGTGLISMAAIALALISKAVQPLPF